MLHVAEPLEPNQPAPAGAMCGAHPQRAAVITCARCGDFACSECASRGLCAACAQRVPEVVFVLDRDSWRVGNVFDHAWRTLNDRSGASTLGMCWALLFPSLLLFSLPMLLLIPGLLSRKIDPKAIYTLQSRLIMQGASTASLLLMSPLLLGLFAYLLGRVAGRRPGFAVVREQLPRVPQYAIVLLAVVPVTLAISLLQHSPDLAAVTPAKPFGAFSIGNTLLSLLAWPILLVQYSAFFELVLDRNVDGLGALRRAAQVLLYRPFATVWTILLINVVALASWSCCFIPAIFGLPFSLLAFETLYLAARTPGRAG